MTVMMACCCGGGCVVNDCGDGNTCPGHSSQGLTEIEAFADEFSVRISGFDLDWLSTPSSVTPPADTVFTQTITGIPNFDGDYVGGIVIRGAGGSAYKVVEITLPAFNMVIESVATLDLTGAGGPPDGIYEGTSTITITGAKLVIYVDDLIGGSIPYVVSANGDGNHAAWIEATASSQVVTSQTLQAGSNPALDNIGESLAAASANSFGDNLNPDEYVNGAFAMWGENHFCYTSETICDQQTEFIVDSFKVNAITSGDNVTESSLQYNLTVARPTIPSGDFGVTTPFKCLGCISVRPGASCFRWVNIEDPTEVQWYIMDECEIKDHWNGAAGARTDLLRNCKIDMPNSTRAQFIADAASHPCPTFASDVLFVPSIFVTTTTTITTTTTTSGSTTTTTTTIVTTNCGGFDNNGIIAARCTDASEVRMIGPTDFLIAVPAIGEVIEWTHPTLGLIQATVTGYGTGGDGGENVFNILMACP